MDGNPAFFAPILQFSFNKLRAVVNTNFLGFSTPFNQLFQLWNHFCRWQAGVNCNVQNFSVELLLGFYFFGIRDVLRNSSMIFRLLTLLPHSRVSCMKSMLHPRYIGINRAKNRLLYSCGKPFLAFASQIQFHRGINPVNPFMIDYVESSISSQNLNSSIGDALSRNPRSDAGLRVKPALSGSYHPHCFSSFCNKIPNCLW